MLKTIEEQLREMEKYAARNRKLVAKALGEKPKEKINPFVQYAQPTKK